MAKISTTHSRYLRGWYYCAKCKWIRPEECHDGPKGRLLHSCGMSVRTRPRQTRAVEYIKYDYMGNPTKTSIREGRRIPYDAVVGSK